METLKDWMRRNPPAPGSFAQSLAGVGRTRDEASFRAAVREFLDEFGLLPTPELRAKALAERPPDTGDPRLDAFLGALAEHLAARHDLERPAWAVESGRFLPRFWFVSAVTGFRAVQIAQSPAAFRRRGIFISEGALRRC